MTKPVSNAMLAVLNQGGGIGSELCSALRVFGADVVYEAPLQSLDRAALSASGARIVVINLVDDEDALDDIQDLLDSSDYEIIVNDNAVSARLTGPDQARWVRHLAAKILRRPDIVLPPRPSGAEALPTFEQHWAARVPVAETIRGEQPAEAVKPSAAPAVTGTPPAVAAATVDVATGSLPDPAPQVFDEAATTPAAPSSDAARDAHDESIEAALLSIEQSTVASEDADLAEDIDVDTMSFATTSADEGDAESALSLSPEFAAVLAPVDADDRYDGVADFEALLAQVHGSEPVDEPITQQRHAIVEREVLSNLDLESIETAISVDAETPFVKAPPARPATAPAAPATPVAAPEWSLAPAEDAPPAPSEFGIEKVPADVYLAPQVEEVKAEPIDPKQIGAAIPRGFAGLELVPIETEEVGSAKNTVAYDTGRDLDPSAARPLKKDDAADPAKDS